MHMLIRWGYGLRNSVLDVRVLQFYSVLWTGDPTGGNLNLRESGEHTHFHSYNHDRDAGHYHFDVTPDEIEYEGYFNNATEVHRVNNIYKELNEKNTIE